MKKWIIRCIVIVFVAGVGLIGVKMYKIMTTPQKVHYHAGFVVFKDNQKIDFSAAKYMSVSPCTLQSDEGEVDMSESDIQREKAHLHEYVGDVVHVERSSAIWKDLFTNLRYPITYASVTAYINGKEVPDFQNQPIKENDSLVLFIGKNDIKKELPQAVTKAHIENAAKKSEDCGK